MYLCPLPNGFRDRAVSLCSCKIVDKEILRIVSNIGIYRSSDKVGTVYLVQYILENSTVSTSSGTTIAEQATLQHINIFGICVGALHLTQHPYSVTVNSYNSKLTLHTESHASYSGAVRRE
jgi:hypothetical protein